MEVLFASLREHGHCAARVPDIDPFFATDAPLEAVLERVRCAGRITAQGSSSTE